MKSAISSKPSVEQPKIGKPLMVHRCHTDSAKRGPVDPDQNINAFVN
jgi:hypothetical protein